MNITIRGAVADKVAEIIEKNTPEVAKINGALNELDSLRAEVERLKGMRTAAEAIMTDVAEANEELAIARAERAEAEIERWRDSNNRLRAEMESQAQRAERAEGALAEAVDGEINGGSIPDTLLVVHVRRSPVGYRVGQPVKVLLPAIDAAMKP